MTQYTGSQATAGRGTLLLIFAGTALAITGTTTSGSASVTSVSSTAGLLVGAPITGPGIPLNTVVIAVGTGTLTLSNNATATGTAVALSVLPGVTIGEVSDFPLERGEWQFDDTTNFQSASDEEQLATIRKTGSVTLKGNRVSSDAGQVLVEAAYQSGALTAFSATLPKEVSQTTSGDTIYYNAFVAQSNFSAETTKAIKFSIKQNITGGTKVILGS